MKEMRRDSMSEELLQRNLLKNPAKIGKWDFYNIGATTVKALKGFGIIRNVDYGAVETKKVDALITQQKEVIAVIEYKKPSEFRTDAQKNKAIAQEIEVARLLRSKIIIATDTQETIWVNALTGERILDLNGEELRFNFDPADEKIVDLIEKVNSSINEQSNAIKPKKLVNPTDLAKSIWQDVWAVSGATPENCLYTFVELFIFKYLSDLGVIDEYESFDHLLAMYSKRDNESVLEYYASNIRPKIKTLFPESDDDKTTIINGTIFVSKDQKAVKGYSTTFRSVLEKFQKYGKLEYIDYDFKSQLFESFLKESISKKNWGQFFTPLKVVRAVASMAKDDIKEGANICDPACGVGKFLLEPLAANLDRFYGVQDGKIKSKVTIHGYDKGFDRDEQKTIILAKANMLIYFSDLIKDNPGITSQFADLFNNSFTLKTNSILGTLSEPIENEYDLILTNPPYVTSGSGNLKDEIRKDGELMNYYKVNAMGVEGLFMEWIVKSLKPGGKAFIVIPDGLLSRQNDKNLRQFLLEECYLDGIISLPLNTFFTTNKKTYILCLTKKIDKSKKQTDPVFTYLVSEVGETRDIYRFDIDQNDLEEAATLYTFFRGNKSSFARINTDKRCKVQPIDEFVDNIDSHWLIDRWWTDDEKVAMGVIDKKDSVSIQEFAGLVETAALNMQSLEEQIKGLSVENEKKKSLVRVEPVAVADLFEVQRGKSIYTKTYGNKNKGKYPVFSASNNAPLTYIDTYDYEGDYLTWATNGFAGYMKQMSGKFSINADRGLLQPLDPRINISYVRYLLEPTLRSLAKGRRGDGGEQEFTKLYPTMIESVKIPMPIDESGAYDEEYQNEVAQKIASIKSLQHEINLIKSDVSNVSINFENDFHCKIYEVGDIFDDVSGFAFKKSLFTAKQNDIEIIRIQNISEKNPKTVRYPATEKIDDKFRIRAGDYLLPLSGSYFKFTLWDKEGVFYLNQRIAKFSLKDEFRGKISGQYLQAILRMIEDEIRQLGYSANNNLRIGDVRKIKIPVPIDSSGNFDLAAQGEIVDKYEKVQEIKEEMVGELDSIIAASVTV